MVDKYTSLELSKKLAENGCKLDSEYWWYQDLNGDTHYVCNDTQDKYLPSQHIAWMMSGAGTGIHRCIAVMNEV